MFKFLLHFGFLVVGLAYMARRSERFYWTTFAVFMAGFVANAVYGRTRSRATRTISESSS